MVKRFSSKAVARIRAAVRKSESDGGGGAGAVRRGVGDAGRPIGIGVVFGGDVAENSWGQFKKARGTKGSETAYGEAYDGYYRTTAGDPSITDGSLIYYVWIGKGYEISPAGCPQ